MESTLFFALSNEQVKNITKRLNIDVMDYGFLSPYVGSAAVEAYQVSADANNIQSTGIFSYKSPSTYTEFVSTCIFTRLLGYVIFKVVLKDGHIYLVDEFGTKEICLYRSVRRMANSSAYRILSTLSS